MSNKTKPQPKTLDQFKAELVAELKAEVNELKNQLTSLEKRVKALEEKSKSGSGELKDLSQIKQELEAYTRRVVKHQIATLKRARATQEDRQVEARGASREPSRAPSGEGSEPQATQEIRVVGGSSPLKRESGGGRGNIPQEEWEKLDGVTKIGLSLGLLKWVDDKKEDSTE